MSGSRQAPHNVQVLERWVGELARQEAIAPARLRRWVSFMVVAGLLDHSRDENGDPVFVLKGGAAMELRLGLRARTTKDFDTAYRHAADEMIDRLDDALRSGHGDFTASRTELEPVADTGAVRLDIKLVYRGRSWATVRLEVAAAEGEAGREIDRIPGRPLDSLGLDAPIEVPCVSVRYQMAQKLHACTELPPPDRHNDRFRDLIDLLLLEELVSARDWAAVRAACEELFQLRNMHVWPPTVTIFDSWPQGYRVLATELGFPIGDVHEAGEAVQRLVSRIARA